MTTTSTKPTPADGPTATVEDLMSTTTIRATSDADVLDVIASMVREGVRHLPVVDADDRVVGIVSDRDIRTAVGDPVAAAHVTLVVLTPALEPSLAARNNRSFLRSLWTCATLVKRTVQKSAMLFPKLWM